MKLDGRREGIPEPTEADLEEYLPEAARLARATFAQYGNRSEDELPDRAEMLATTYGKDSPQYRRFLDEQAELFEQRKKTTAVRLYYGDRVSVRSLPKLCELDECGRRGEYVSTVPPRARIISAREAWSRLHRGEEVLRLCRPHAKRVRENGTPYSPPLKAYVPRPFPEAGESRYCDLCGVPSDRLDLPLEELLELRRKREVHALGLCAMHYRRFQRTGTTELLGPKTDAPKECSVIECERPTHANGLCKSHDQRRRRALRRAERLRTGGHKEPQEASK